MSHNRSGLLFLACAVLWVVSCTRSASQNSHVAPTPVLPSTSGLAASSAEYPDTTEGLQNLMKDMLSAAKRGDREMVDALIKRTEFADYAHYFGITYSPDPLAAKEWATPYQQWLGENEDHLRELLETLAKDEDGNILVRKANDDPAPGRGFEWGMLHYARIPIDVYRVTLVFRHLPDGPGESIGYFVYADGMFRWDSIVPFAAPGTYQSDPGTVNVSQTQAVGSAQYPDTPNGLQKFLSELWAAAKSGDQAKVHSMIKQTEIPDYRNWFCSVYVPGSGLSWAIPYGNYLVQNEQTFEALWEKLAQDEGEIRVQSRMSHSSRTPLDIYDADWKSRTGARDEWIGEFIYIDGMFRWNSTVHRAFPSRVRVSNGVIDGLVEHRTLPKYPEAAIRAGFKGDVIFKVVIDETGKIVRSEPVEGQPLLIATSMDALRDFRFRPYQFSGRPIQVESQIGFHFEVKGKGDKAKGKVEYISTIPYHPEFGRATH